MHHLQADVLADEALELVGRNLAEAFETRDFGAAAHLLQRGFLFGRAVAIHVALLVAHAEEGSLQDIQVPGADHVGVEFQEEGEHQQADVHTVDIGIGRDDDIVITEAFRPIFDAQGRLEQGEFHVLFGVEVFLRGLGAVERLAHQAEHGLGVGVAALGDAAGGGVTLGDEQGALFGERVAVAVVDAAVAQFLVVDRGFLEARLGLLADGGDGVALFFRILDLGQDDVGHVEVFVQVVVQVSGEEVQHRLRERRAVRAFLLVLPHIFRAELHLGLAFELGLLDADAHGADDGLPDVHGIEIFLVEILEHLGDGFLEGRQVRAAQRGVLAVDEGVDVLAIAAAVGEGHLDVLRLQVDRGIEGLFVDGLVEQVEQAVLRFVLLAVEGEFQADVEVRIVAQHRVDVLGVVFIRLEEGVVGDERDERAVFLRRGFRGEVGRDENAFFVFEGERFAVPERLDGKPGGEGVGGLQADAVHTYRFLEGLVVELGAGVEFAHGGVEQVLRLVFLAESEGDAAAVVADGDHLVLDLDLDELAVAHRELVDGVVDDFLHQHVHAVVRRRTVAQAADVHTRTQPDVLQVFQVDDALVAVIVVGNIQGLVVNHSQQI